MPANQPDLFQAKPQILSVSELTHRIKSALETRIGAVWIEGEISNFRQQSSGHCYFTLKDSFAQVSAVLFRSDAVMVRFRLADGLQVIAFGDVTVYEARGQYQIIVRELMPKGLGALQLAFEQLKRKLEAEGLFAAERKKPIPLLPQRIGIITSPSGAAIRDFLNVVSRRFPNLHVVIHPVRVQGDGAAEEIAAAVDEFNHLHEILWLRLDVLILARGGGSIEDLWEFNEEIVARAVARSRIPTISAVGHEIDFTICDFVADLRAATPSAAAELVVQKKEEFAGLLYDFQSRLLKDLRLRLSDIRQQFEKLAQSYVFREPANIVRQFQQRVDDCGGRLAQHWDMRCEQWRGRLHAATEKLRVLSPNEKLRDGRHRLDSCRNLFGKALFQAMTNSRTRLRGLHEQLNLLSPRAILERGYSITRRADDNKLVKSVKGVGAGTKVKTLVADGEFESEVV